MKKHVALINAVSGGYEIQGVHEISLPKSRTRSRENYCKESDTLVITHRVSKGGGGTRSVWVENTALGHINDRAFPFGRFPHTARFSVDFEDLVPVLASKFFPINPKSQSSGGSWQISEEALREVVILLGLE